MNIFARKLVCLLVCLCQIIVGTNTTAQFNGVMEEGAIIKSYSATISQQSINEISNALDLYFDCLYSSRADLSTKLYYNSHLFDRANIEATEFYERDIAIMNSLADALLTHGDMYKYCTYTTKKDYSITEVNGSYAKAVASIECDFSYVGSPEIDSASWLLYEVQLVNYQNHWEVISRSYPEFTEANINIDDYVTENHNALSSLETHCETVEADARLLHPYNRNLAAYNANEYVQPTGTSGGHYVYNYPNGYYDAYSADCTNFVSFCMNYNGGIPQDTSGNYEWWSSSSYYGCSMSWINVDYFYDYLINGDEGVANGGIVAGCFYSGATYPSPSVVSTLQIGDIVQFSSAGGGSDWTHSAIVSKISSSTGPHICNHSVASAYRNCALADFYSHYASLNASYYIRLISILGYH